MKRAEIIAILLLFNGLKTYAQIYPPSNTRIKQLTYLTQNLDSLTRSFIKKGFTIQPGLREADGIFSNFINLQDSSQIILETTTSSDSSDWRRQALKKYGSHIAGIAFEVDGIDSLYQKMILQNIPVSPLYKSDKIYFALDSIAPLDVVFFLKDSSNQDTSFSHHYNHVLRFDWILLSPSPEIENKLRKIFGIISTLKLHEGCCDFWRTGPADDFCFFRFEINPPKAKGKKNWLFIEPDGVYFAY